MIRVGVIGAGHWGPNLIRNFNNPPASELLWVVDRDQRRRDEVHKHFPFAALSTEAADVLTDPKVDAVVVVTEKVRWWVAKPLRNRYTSTG